MVVAVMRVELDLPASRSLKDKRQVVRSLLTRVAQQYRISAAEVDRLDDAGWAVLGLACVSNSTPHANEVLSKAVSFIESNVEAGNLVEYTLELVHVF